MLIHHRNSLVADRSAPHDLQGRSKNSRGKEMGLHSEAN